MDVRSIALPIFRNVVAAARANTSEHAIRASAGSRSPNKISKRSSDVENVRVFCQAHNHLAAEREYGRKKIEDAVEKQRERPRAPKPLVIRDIAFTRSASARVAVWVRARCCSVAERPRARSSPAAAGPDGGFTKTANRSRL